MPELHPLLASRWSPRGFDSGHEVGQADLASLLEAARWAPSRGNSQPWRFVVGHRDDEPYKRIYTHLGAEDQRWAWRAAVLIAAAYEITGAPRAVAAFDLGLAVAHMCVQATALGLHTRQIAGFDAARLHADLELPGGISVHTVVAVGLLGDPASLPADLRTREFRLRDRLPVAELVLAPGR
jgi:nitroreductase